jgi:hypothetical protein
VARWSSNDPSGKASIEVIKMRLMHLARMFSDGNLNAPMMIHDTHSFFQIVDHQTGVAPTVQS